jgi:hypothetical protein
MGALARVMITAALLMASDWSAAAADQALIEAARKEGVINWYTTQIVDQFARPAATAFEKHQGQFHALRSRTHRPAHHQRVQSRTDAGRCLR